MKVIQNSTFVLEYIAFDDVNLHEGRWSDVFRLLRECGDVGATLRYLRLSELGEDGGMWEFSENFETASVRDKLEQLHKHESDSMSYIEVE